MNKPNIKESEKRKISVTVRHMRRLAAEDAAIFLADIDARLHYNSACHSEAFSACHSEAVNSQKTIRNERSCNISENVAAAYNLPDEDYPSVNSRAEINVEIGYLDNENEQFLTLNINFIEILILLRNIKIKKMMNLGIS